MWTPTELHEFLRSRRSVRRFNPTPVDDQVLERIIETAMCAPSSHNRQPWRFAVITEIRPKFRLAQQMAEDFRRDLFSDHLAPEEVEARVNRSVQRILEAPVVIVLCMDLSEMDVYPDEKRSDAERIMAIQSTAAAGLQLQLAAWAEGMGSVWTCSPLFAPGSVRDALGLSETWQPQAMFFIGNASEPPRPKTVKPLEAVIVHVS